MFARVLFGVLVIFTIVGAQAGWAAPVNLAWDPCIETNLAGYRLYYGPTPRSQGTYPNMVVISKSAVTWQLTLSSGTYFFALTAFDTSGNESTFSNEVSAVVPIVQPLGKPGKPVFVP